MPEDCNNKNPLPRSGTSQYQRVLSALLPQSARIDERDDADLILFVKKYAEYLNYYSSSNLADGDWTVFMKLDISVVLATIVKQKPATYFTYISWIYNIINDYGKPGFAEKYGSDLNNDTAIKLQYKSLYDFIYTLIYGLDEHYSNLPADFGFKDYLGNTIRSKMAEQVFRLRKYYNESIIAGNDMIDENAMSISARSPIEISPVQTLLQQQLTQIWNTAITFTPAFNGADAITKIKNTVNHNIFKGVVENILKQVSAIADTAKPYLNQTVTDFPKHSPHYALYLTFLKLFRYAQDDLNLFTERHLDFYYKDILQLQIAESQPDSAHLVFELAKNTSQYQVKKDTIFKAGKNEAGVELFYGLTDDIVLNKGTLKSVKSIFSKKRQSGIRDYLNLYYAPVANSKDGKGEALGEGDAWKIFGDPAANDMATMGIAIAHSFFFLKEGNRTVDLYIDFEGDLSEIHNLELKTYLSLQLTGAEEWVKDKFETAIVNNTTKQFHLKFILPESVSAIVPYSSTLHGEGFDTGLPVIKILAKNIKNTFNPGLELAEAKIKKIQINLDVKGIKNVAIQNDVSVLDAAKPFPIFGPVPHVGSSFIIGSNEIFLKNSEHKVDAILNIDWDQVDKLDTNAANADNYNYFTGKKIKISYLHNGVWQFNTGDSKLVQEIFIHTHPTVDGITYHTNINDKIELNLPAFGNSANFNPDLPCTVDSRNGFMKIEFKGPRDFGHSSYVSRIINGAKTGGTPPPEPYTPAVKSFSIDYTASDSFSLTLSAAGKVSDKEGRFYHIYPFGPAQQHKHFLGLTESITAVLPLFPVFNNEGEAFIGISNFAANQTLSMLFQLSEGSANPNKERQDVKWYYLTANNIWKEFEKNNVVDNTNDLTKSGIIRFSFDPDSTDVNNIMGEQLFWIRATVVSDSDATCQAVQLHAQAAVAMLTDYGNAGVEYNSVLEAGKISKLLMSDSHIKKISQPYASFNGKSKETSPEFYTHTSERLRHKKRAITIWDYERMVLQEFPQIYKVKCLNHTEVRIKASSEDDNEIAPGHVTVVTVPDLTNLNAVNPLRPQTSLGILEEIKLFLEQYTSPFVNVQVKNPKFEEIQLDFKVKFIGDDTSYYHDVLINDLEQYLSPWVNGGTQNIDFGGRISKSVLLNFIEERTYVDFVTCLKMNHIVDGIFHYDVEEAIATTARTVFVSYAGSSVNLKHKIEFENVDCNCT
jgi:hypothetical protein